ncbi:MAG: hypothetical protein A2512_10020 [Deltaproteobacteria bacterium RIFOXYD12_FULL_56_24]|nr:MAG: hypothetical protein A2512_10020 [Deltaproteobacteria bacterium RIFOXYD12_FULL_56_24]
MPSRIFSDGRVFVSAVLAKHCHRNLSILQDHEASAGLLCRLVQWVLDIARLLANFSMFFEKAP